MIKVLVAALVGTIVGVTVMVSVIAITGTDTKNASSVGLGSLPLSTASPTSTPSSSTTPTSGGTSTGATGDPVKGKTLFTAKTCSSCHSVTPGAASPFPGAPNLADLAPKLDEARILKQIASPAPPMPAGLATGQDAADIAAYILSLGK
ncbi:MAG: c-type cytochrome [Gaiellales bacterium]